MAEIRRVAGMAQLDSYWFHLSVANALKIPAIIFKILKKILQSLDPLATNQYICRLSYLVTLKYVAEINLY